MDNDEPWWWPTELNAERYDAWRREYPEKADWSDEDLAEYFADGWTQFYDNWGNLGGAREEYEKLARAFLNLVKETGKSPADFKDI